MGYEYHARLVAPRVARAIDAVLRAHPTFTELDRAYGSYRFRRTPELARLPSAEIQLVLDADGAVVLVTACDYGDGRAILVELAQSLGVLLTERE